MLKDEFTEKLFNPEYKNLSEEIALARLLIEDLWNSCEDQPELLRSNMPVFLDCFVKIEKLVSSAHKIGRDKDSTLSEAELGAFAMDIISIITDHVSDPKALKRISSDIVNLMEDKSEQSDKDSIEED